MPRCCNVMMTKGAHGCTFPVLFGQKHHGWADLVCHVKEREASVQQCAMLPVLGEDVVLI